MSVRAKEKPPKMSRASRSKSHPVFYKGRFGQVIHGNSLTYIQSLNDKSVNLIVTSPPFGLLREKEYGNVAAEEYNNWIKPFGEQFHRVLKEDGSLVIDLGGSWERGQPTRSLYQFEVLIMLCRELGFHLAQDFYWWNPSKLPTPAEWVTVRRVRVKDAVNQIWWLSKTPWPKASNTRVLQPYSDSMMTLLRDGYRPSLRPSGHDISDQFQKNNGAAIPPNLIAVANTESNSPYIKYCKARGIKPHPARFPMEVPEYFIRMLTDEGDTVLDPFAGSCSTGAVCERLHRKWVCLDLELTYLEGARGRFETSEGKRIEKGTLNSPTEYKIPKAGSLWGLDSHLSGQLRTGKSRNE
jgi:site-specific DNA-methyltransferase (cytosine-N4-specific)